MTNLTRQISYTALTAVLLLILASCTCQPPLAPDSGQGLSNTVSVTLESRKINYTPEDHINIRFVFRNTTENPVTVLKRNTPLEGFTGDYLHIEHKGKKVPYIGKLVDRGPINKNDFITIKPGQSVAVVLDLLKGYKIREPGDYSIEYRPQHIIYQSSQFKSFGDRIIKAKDIKRFNSTTVYVKKSMDPCAKDKRMKKLPEGWEDSFPKDPYNCNGTSSPGTGTSPRFSNCTSTQESTLRAALTESRSLSSESYSALQNGPNESMRQYATRYTTWFGHYAEPRWNTVKATFQKSRNALADHSIRFYCDCTDSYNAYTYGNREYQIWICTNYWTYSTSGGAASQGSIILHESTHWNIVGGTDDHAYGVADCQTLADDDPGKAIDNADSYEYFATNHLNLGMFYQETRDTCTSTEDCGPNKVCRSGLCVSSNYCSGSTPCPGNQVCLSNRCAPRGESCDRVIDCPSGQWCIDHSCVSSPYECNTDSQCGDSAACIDNLCWEY